MDRQMRKMNYLYANLRLIFQATMLPERLAGCPVRSKANQPPRHLCRRSVQAGFSWRQGGDGSWMAGFLEIGSNSDGIPSRAKRRCLGRAGLRAPGLLAGTALCCLLVRRVRWQE